MRFVVLKMVTLYCRKNYESYKKLLWKKIQNYVQIWSKFWMICSNDASNFLIPEKKNHFIFRFYEIFAKIKYEKIFKFPKILTNLKMSSFKFKIFSLYKCDLFLIDYKYWKRALKKQTLWCWIRYTTKAAIGNLTYTHFMIVKLKVSSMPFQENVQSIFQAKIRVLLQNNFSSV